MCTSITRLGSFPRFRYLHVSFFRPGLLAACRRRITLLTGSLVIENVPIHAYRGVQHTSLGQLYGSLAVSFIQIIT